MIFTSLPRPSPLPYMGLTVCNTNEFVQSRFSDGLIIYELYYTNSYIGAAGCTLKVGAARCTLTSGQPGVP